MGRDRLDAWEELSVALTDMPAEIAEEVADDDEEDDDAWRDQCRHQVFIMNERGTRCARCGRSPQYIKALKEAREKIERGEF